MQKAREGADDRDGRLPGQAAERIGHLLRRFRLLAAVEADRVLSHPFDDRKNLFAFVLAHGVTEQAAQQAAQQADVLTEREILGGRSSLDGLGQ